MHLLTTILNSRSALIIKQWSSIVFISIISFTVTILSIILLIILIIPHRYRQNSHSDFSLILFVLIFIIVFNLFDGRSCLVLRHLIVLVVFG